MRLKRLISAFIACAMLVTFMPMQAFAAPKDIFNDTEFHIMQMDEIKEFVRKANDDLSSDAEIEIYGINVYGTTILGEDGSATGGITDNAKWLALGDYGSAANGRDLINPKDYWTVLNDAAILNLDYPITSIEILSKINGTKNTSVAYLDEDSYKVEEIKGKLVTEIYLTNATPEPPKEEHTITYKIVNGTWKNGETVLTETVEDGECLAKIPDVTSAEPDQGYGPEGGWDTVPSNEKAVTEDATYVYTFAKKQIEDSTDGYFYVLKPESQEPGTTDPQHFYYVGKGSLQETPEEKFDFDNGVEGQIISFPEDWPEGADEIESAVGENFKNVFWYRISLENGANSNTDIPAKPSTPEGQNAWHVDGILMPQNPNYQVRFILRQDETETVLNVYDIESGIPISDERIVDTANKALEIGKPGEGYVVQWKNADGQVVTDEQIISATRNAEPKAVLVFYAEFTKLVQPAMPTVQDALAVYKKTVVAPESAEPFQPTVFKFKLEKQGADEGWKDVESLTGELSTVPVSQSVQNLTIAGTTDELEAGTYRLSEIQTAEDLMSWEENDRQFEFTVTDDGKIVRDEEATVFVNTYLAPDLSIEKALTLVNGKQYNDGQSVQSGDVLTYQITVKNDGNKDARGPFNVTDSMWSGNGLLDSVEFTNANEEISNSPVEAYPISGGTIVVQEVPAGSQYVFTYHYTVQMADEGKTLSNTVKLTSSDVDINDSVNVEVEKTHCTVTYGYQSGTAGKQLPNNFLTPPDAQVVAKGSNLVLPSDKPEQTEFVTDDGVWEFLGWRTVQGDQNLPISVEDDMHIIGLWNFKPTVTVDDVLEHFQKEFTVTSGVNGQAIFRFEIANANGQVITNLIQANTQRSGVAVPLQYTGDEKIILQPGTYTLYEVIPQDDASGITYDQSRIQFTITDDAEIQDKEKNPVTGILYTFKNSLVMSPYTIEKTVVDKDGKPIDTVYRIGDTVYYKITVGSINTWPTGETVKVFDQLPAGLKLVSAEALDKSVTILSQENNTVVAEANAPGSILVTAEVLVSYDAEYDNIASVDDGDPNTKDDPKTDPVPIKIAALDVQKTLMDNSKVYNVGDTVKYQITFKNIGNVALKQFDITDAVPAGLEIVDSAWENGKFIGQLADELKPGEQKTIAVEVKITDYRDSYVNKATVTAENTFDGSSVIKDGTNADLKVNPNHDVKVQYVFEDEAGEVTLDKATLSAKHNASWKVSVSDTESLTDVSKLTVAKTVELNEKHYAFKEFRNEQLSGTVTQNVTIIAVYGLDEIGGEIDLPDGVPDEYQATVTYRVVNGTWSDGTDADRVEIFTLYEFHPETASWTRIPDVTLDDTIPTGMLADAGYVGQSGAWNKEITSETAVTTNATYIYRFGDADVDEIVVYYEDDGSGYGEVTSAHRQVFTVENWEPITGTEKYVMIHLTATAEDDGGRTYFDEWQGSLVDDLDRDITEDEDLDVWVEAEIGQTYTIIADFGRDSGGGAQHPDAGDDDDDDNDRDDDTEEIIDEEVPLAETPWLNTEDHYAYIVGYSEDGTVRPNANITRAEVATIFFRLLTDSARDQFWMTSNNFSDVLPNDWYNTAVSTMVNMGIIQGYEDGTFRPNANITRAEFAAIAARFMASGYGVEDDLFTDIANHWARESINDAAMAGWINGYEDGTFRPDAAITRAEAVTLVNNVLQRKPDADHMLDSMIKWPDNPEGTWYYEAIQEATNSHDYDLFEDAEYETWTALQENRDWAALEKDWANAHSA